MGASLVWQTKPYGSLKTYDIYADLSEARPGGLGGIPPGIIDRFAPYSSHRELYQPKNIRTDYSYNISYILHCQVLPTRLCLCIPSYVLLCDIIVVPAATVNRFWGGFFLNCNIHYKSLPKDPTGQVIVLRLFFYFLIIIHAL